MRGQAAPAAKVGSTERFGGAPPRLTLKENEMTVADLIEFLQKQPQDLLVAYEKYSEQVLLSAEEVQVVERCEPRPDGWIQHKRPDMPSRAYLMFPGN